MDTNPEIPMIGGYQMNKNDYKTTVGITGPNNRF
jgi:hypothetical protein